MYSRGEFLGISEVELQHLLIARCHVNRQCGFVGKVLVEPILHYVVHRVGDYQYIKKALGYE